MAFKRFRTKIDDQLDPADILLHYVDMLDEMALVGFREGDGEYLSIISDKMLDASDRLMGLAAMGYENEESNVREQPKPKFGFNTTSPVDSSPPPDS